MEELFIVKNLLSAAAFGAALIAERRRNRVAAHPAEEGEDAPLDTLQRVVQTAGDTPLADWPYDALWAAARRVGACCGACLSPDARSGTHLLRTFSDGAVGEHAAAALLHCEATREAQAQRAPVLGHPERDAALRAASVTAVFAAPLGDGARAGVVAFGTRREEGFAREDAVLLGGLAVLLETAGSRGQQPARVLSPAWRRLADEVPIPLILADASGGVIVVNAACEDLTGVRAEDLVGGTACECFAALGADEHATGVMCRAVEDGASAAWGARHSLPGGRELAVHWQLSRLSPDGPDAPALVFCGLDLTECLTMQRELVRSERLCAVGQLTAGIAHELNNALTAVTGLAELAQGQVAGEHGRAYLERLLAQAQRCRRIADSLLGFVRERDPRREPVAVSDLVAETVALVRCRFELDGLALTATTAPDLPPVMGDSGELQQVLINLLINAQQALAEAGGGAAQVTARHDGQGVEVVVRDNGPGIPPHILDTLFDPFVTTKPEGQGTGLGLSISREIAGGHGGSLEARNRPEGGAEFRLLLPALEPPTAPRCGGERADAPATAGRGRILIIDDEEPVRLVMREALRDAGHETEETGDGPAALDLISERDYDIIICDLHMPSMSGEEFCEQAQANRPELADRIIVTTGDGSTPQARSFLERYGLRCIQKPFSARELVALVNARLAAAGDCSGNAAARGGRE